MANPWLFLALLGWQGALGPTASAVALPPGASACDFDQAYRAAYLRLAGPAPKEGVYPVALLNVSTCEVVVESGTRAGDALITPHFTLRLEDGHRYNGMNTRFTVVSPGSGWAVLMDRWVQRAKHRAKKRMTVTVVMDIRYVPASHALLAAFPKLVARGQTHFDGDLDEALMLLDAQGAMSRAFPGTRLSDIGRAWRADIKLIPWAEHTEVGESFELAKFVVGANPLTAFPTSNSVKARGLMQIYYQTCDRIRDNYGIDLPADCNSAGRASHAHVTSIMAAIAVWDENMGDLQAAFGPAVFQRRDARHILFAAFNDGTVRLRRAIPEYGDQWAAFHPAKKRSTKPAKTSLPLETIGYMHKYQALRDAVAATVAVTISAAHR